MSAWYQSGPRSSLPLGHGRPATGLVTQRRELVLPMGVTRPVAAIQKRHRFAKRNYTDSSNSEHSDSKTDGHTQGKIFRLPKGSSKEFGVYWKGKKIVFGAVRSKPPPPPARRPPLSPAPRTGDPSMPNHQNNDERRANFNARHGCSEKKDKTKAGYWAVRAKAHAARSPPRTHRRALAAANAVPRVAKGI